MEAKSRNPFRLLALMALAGIAAWAAFACQNTGTHSSSLFSGGGPARDRWTIRCARIEAPNHTELANVLATQLKRVPGLSASKVRVTSGAGASVVYYGEYEKVPAPDGSFVFPPEYQRDIEMIRQLAYQNQTPFFFAAPELIAQAEAALPSGAEGDVSTARGTHSLQIAVFYNTPEFNQRKEAAEAYVKDLRERGHAAYYYHETLRSFVFVGDFDASDLVQSRDGRIIYGPRVEQYVARNPEEFKYVTENGMRKKYTLPDGRVLFNESILLPLPGRSPPAGGTVEPRRLPGEGRY